MTGDGPVRRFCSRKAKRKIAVIIRKFRFSRRCTATLFVLLFGVFAPIGCAQTPNNLFSKVWGPERITFKDAVGLGDSRSKKKTNTIFADKLRNKSGINQSSKLADRDSKTIGQKIGNFGKVLITGFNRPDTNGKSVKKTASANPQTKARIGDVRRRLASNNKPKGDPALRNLGKSSAAETLRKNRMRNNLKTNKNLAQSQYASRPSGGRNSLDKSRTNPFAEFLDTQNPNQSRRNVESANTKIQGNTLAQADNPFADVRNQSIQKPVKQSTDLPSDNQFVAEFDNSYEKISREQEQFDDDDESDETDELDDLDETDGTRKAQSLASSSLAETNPFQDTNLSRREKNREQVDSLMLSAHSELAQGRSVDALNYARNAEKLAANEGVFFGPREEHPGDLVRSIRDKMETKVSQAEKLPPTNPVIVLRNRKNTIRDTGIPSRKTENTNPFAELEPSEKRFAALPQPPEKTASVEEYDSFRALENSNHEAFEPRTAETKPRSYAELQTVIVEVSDPFDGMIVASDSVPPRIPIQSNRANTDRLTIIRPADAKTTKYLTPKTISQNVLNRLKSSPPPPADVDKKRSSQTQQFRSRTKSNRSNSQQKQPKRVNSNRGARIITTTTTKYKVPLELDNVWCAVETKKQGQVETAELTVVQAEQAEKPVKVASKQPEIATNDRFFQMGGSSEEEAQLATSLADWDKDTEYKAGSRISELRERFLIIACLVIAGLFVFGIRRRYSLRLLWHKFASR
jgi:hypothetical protein